VSFTVDGEQISRIDIVLAPDKLSGVPSARP
jgi:RNA polymerase sigma-70 factor (ECF subfamily)